MAAEIKGIMLVVDNKLAPLLAKEFPEWLVAVTSEARADIQFFPFPAPNNS